MQTLPTLLVLCLILFSGSTALVRLPINRHSTPSAAQKAITTPSILKKAVKASYQFPHQLPLKIDSNFNVDITKVDSIEFSFNMTIGTPPQNFSIVL